MDHEFKSLIVYSYGTSPLGHNAAELNDLYAQGWRFYDATPLGGGGQNNQLAVLVTLKRACLAG